MECLVEGDNRITPEKSITRDVIYALINYLLVHN